MGKHRAVSLPSPAALAAALMVDDAGRLVWKDRPKDNRRHAGRLAGSLRPDGRRIVSMRFGGRMRSMAADRVCYALTHQRWPKGRVEVEDGALVDKPRRARSPGRRGGLKAERARDQAALDALEGGAQRLVQVAEAVGGERCNVRRRLLKLAEQGLVEAPPRCCPDRGYMLTKAGRDATLVDAPASPAPTNGHRWLKPLRVLTADDFPGNGMSAVRFG